MSEDFDKVMEVLGAASQLLSVAVPVGHELYGAAIAIGALGKRIERGDMPTKEEVMAAVVRTKQETTNLATAVEKNKKRNKK